jgi:hypothetical protein
MLLEIQDKIVSLDLFEKKFVCDLSACKGACCIEGDAGAPLKKEEVTLLNENLEKIMPFMREEGIAAVKKQGVSYNDIENEPVTSLINNKECVFVHYDANNIAKCAIETAHLAGEISNLKPLSCHLYPIRAKKYAEFEALNYSEWKICAPACACGEHLNVKVYKFLKEPIVRAYGKAFYEEMEIVDRELEKQKPE